MMYKIIGILYLKGNIVELPTRKGDTLKKMEIVLDAPEYDQRTGQRYDNYPKLEVIGDRCDTIAQSVDVGDKVSVSFDVKGRKYEKDGDDRFFNSLVAYQVDLLEKAQPQSAQPQQPQPQPQAQATGDGDDDLPF